MSFSSCCINQTLLPNIGSFVYMLLKGGIDHVVVIIFTYTFDIISLVYQYKLLMLNFLMSAL